MPQEALNTLFLCICIILVLLMQAGFLCLEAGAVRNKNSINVAAKNLLDLIAVTCAYALIGYQVQYGSFDRFLSGQPVISGTHLPDGVTDLFMVFQTLFAATAATIVSGAIAERCGLRTYLAISLLVATLIYPIAGSWVWGGVLATPTGWLSELGFVDFAGSAVVHSLGGAVALAAIIIIGPRREVFAKSTAFKGQNLVISLLGVLFLWVGWFGFNIGSLLTITPLLPKVFLNTFFAGCAGGMTAILWSYIYYKQANIPVIANGV
ncbi:MAG: ammonium transporter, partial [Endozoicomonas sp.]